MKKVIALGAENKTSFSAMSENGIYVSNAVEDLNDLANYSAFEADVKKYIDENDMMPQVIACDLHPDYRSTLLAEDLRKESNGADIIQVQHHFAHITSCMFDNDIDEKVIGVAFDGTGYGSDGASWGGEFLMCTRDDFERLFHLKYIPQPGGDIASREGWRMALAYLVDAYDGDIENVDTPLLKRIEKNKTSLIKQMIDKDVNCPKTSSMGRLFDAVSSLTGICDISSFEAEGAILLEKKAKKGITDYYDFEIGVKTVNVSRMIRQIVEDIDKGVSQGIISAKFHNTIMEIVYSVSKMISDRYDINKVLISGGCFQNKYLVDHLELRFKGSELKFFKHIKYSPTDLGISIGQAVVAANR